MNEYLVQYVTEKDKFVRRREMTLKAENRGQAYSKFVAIQKRSVRKERLLEVSFSLISVHAGNKTVH